MRFPYRASIILGCIGVFFIAVGLIVPIALLVWWGLCFMVAVIELTVIFELFKRDR